MTDIKTNREIVQEGLDARAEARAEAAQEAQDAMFLEELNKITAANLRTLEALEAAKQRVRERRQAKHQEEAEAARRDSFMNRIFTALCIIAATIWLHNIQAVAFWLALTTSLSGLLYIIINTAGYFTRNKRKEN